MAELYHLGVDDSDLPNAALLVEPELADLVWPTSWRRTPLARRREFNSWLLSTADDAALVCSGGLGSPACVIALEELARAGCRVVLNLGVCRCADCEPGDGKHSLVVVTGAAREEGTSADYAPSAFPAVPDPRFLLSLQEALPGATSEIVRTVDVPDAWRGLARDHPAPPRPVDLASAALFVSGAARGVSVGSVLTTPRAAARIDLDAVLTALSAPAYGSRHA